MGRHCKILENQTEIKSIKEKVMSLRAELSKEIEERKNAGKNTISMNDYLKRKEIR